MKEASEWLRKYFDIIPKGGTVLDLACGGGRHSTFLSEKGFSVVAVDIDIEAITQEKPENTDILYANLEADAWPFNAVEFDGIVVVNYLWRSQFSDIKNSLKPGGVVIFDTFMIGNEEYGRPTNSKFLLKSGELKDAFADMDIIAFEEGYVDNPSPAMRQSIVARKKA